jgi:5-formyltetrahydrofolate cyclo-ligase
MNRQKRKNLRQTVLTKRNSLAERERTAKSISIASRIMKLPEMTNARVCFVYMHFRSEVRTTAIINYLLAAEQTVVMPCTLPHTSQLAAVEITDPEKQLVPGYCGIPEPLPALVATGACDPGIIDVAIVPGSVFDRFGGRLGYGGGYYDRFLATDAPRAVRIGVAFEMQMVERVPVEAHDQFMDFVVTEKNLYDCRRNRHAENSGLS